MRRIGIFWGLIGLLSSAEAIAADPIPAPFFYSGATIVEPQIANLMVGVNENIQRATVSPDRKYVTLGVDTTSLDSGGIRNFTYQQGGSGFVGSAAPVKAPGDSNSLTPSIAQLPSEIGVKVSILDKPGMVLIAPLGR